MEQCIWVPRLLSLTYGYPEAVCSASSGNNSRSSSSAGGSGPRIGTFRDLAASGGGFAAPPRSDDEDDDGKPEGEGENWFAGGERRYVWL